MQFDLLVEGVTDEVAATMLLEFCGHTAGTTFGRRGAGYLLRKLAAFSVRAKHAPLLVLVDLMDTGISCARDIVPSLLPDKHQHCLLRAVVPELEGWLLADREGVASFLRISQRLIPSDPEEDADPKRTLVNLARRSGLARRRHAIVPRPGASGTVGPGYTDEVILFMREFWSIERARPHSESLRRCLIALQSANATEA